MNAPNTIKIGQRLQLELPDTNLPIYFSSSMRDSFKACRRKFYYEYVRNRQPSSKSIHLHAGGAFAAACEAVRIARYHHQRTWRESLLDGTRVLMQRWGESDSVDLAGTGKSMENMVCALWSYFEHFGLDQDTIHPFIKHDGSPAVEHSFAIPIEGTKHPETGEPFLYVGRFDMLAERNGILYVVDEKTTSAMGEQWAKQWPLRGQFIGYAWAAQSFGHPVAGAIVRGTKITNSGNLGHAECLIQIPPYLIDKWLEQLKRDLNELTQCYTENRWDYEFASACGSYGGCPFQLVCESRFEDPWLDSNYESRTWNPVTGEAAPEWNSN